MSAIPSMSDLIRIVEGRDAPLFHHMRAAKAIAVFAQDCMPARWEHDVPGLGRIRGNSFTRNPRLAYPGDVCLTMDQTRLAQTHRIMPLDAEYVHGHSDPSYRPDPKNLRDRKDNRYGIGQGYLMSEEFVIGEIVHLHRYITAIHVGGGLVDDEGVAPLTEAAQNYGLNYGIPVEVADYLMATVSRFQQ